MRRAGTVLAMAMTLAATAGSAAENTIAVEDQTMTVVSSLAVYHPGDQALELHFFFARYVSGNLNDAYGIATIFLNGINIHGKQLLPVRSRSSTIVR